MSKLEKKSALLSHAFLKYSSAAEASSNVSESLSILFRFFYLHLTFRIFVIKDLWETEIALKALESQLISNGDFSCDVISSY